MPWLRACRDLSGGSKMMTAMPHHFGHLVMMSLVNMSVWQDVESLKSFVYASGHVDIMRRRSEWFAKMIDAHMVMWWVPAGTLPTFEDGQERLNALKINGPSPFAFTFARPFPSGD